MEAVLFDLDDTLIDFRYSRRHGLRAVQGLLPAVAPVPLEELELVHDEQLHANYLRTLGGSLSDGEARLERMRGICGHYGLQPDETVVAEAAGAYAREQRCGLTRLAVPNGGRGVRARAAVECALGPGRSRAA